MKYTIHTAKSRGHADHGWLKANHTFSFAHYFDQERMGHGTLRVINDDRIAAQKGFATHPHQNMEIISIPLEGSLAHKDTMGNASTIEYGEVQLMSAGSGIAHSEYNPLRDQETNLLQIWVLPNRQDGAPSYQQKAFDKNLRQDRWQLLVSPDQKEGSLKINQEAYFSQVELGKNKEISYKPFNLKNKAYLFVIDGQVSLSFDKIILNKRDGLALDHLQEFKLLAQEKANILLMEIP